MVLVGLAGISIASQHHITGRKCRHALDDGHPEWFKRIIIINLAFEASTPQYGKGNFAVNSKAYWRTTGAMSNPIFQNLCFIRADSVAKLAPVKIAGIILSGFAFSPLAGAGILG